MPANKSIYMLMGVVQRDPREWQRPNEFLPERYDPSSPLFKRSDGGNRNPYSHIPFTFGSRNCPGQVLGLLESKLFVAYVILKMQYDVDLDPELHGKDKLYFNLNNVECHLKVRATNISR